MKSDDPPCHPDGFGAYFIGFVVQLGLYLLIRAGAVVRQKCASPFGSVDEGRF